MTPLNGRQGGDGAVAVKLLVDRLLDLALGSVLINSLRDCAFDVAFGDGVRLAEFGVAGHDDLFVQGVQDRFSISDVIRRETGDGHVELDVSGTADIQRTGFQGLVVVERRSKTNGALRTGQARDIHNGIALNINRATRHFNRAGVDLGHSLLDDNSTAILHAEGVDEAVARHLPTGIVGNLYVEAADVAVKGIHVGIDRFKGTALLERAARPHGVLAGQIHIHVGIDQIAAVLRIV